MIFRCVFTVINMCFFVSSSRFFFARNDEFLGVGLRHRRLQLVVAHQIGRLPAVDRQSVVHGARPAHRFGEILDDLGRGRLHRRVVREESVALHRKTFQRGVFLDNGVFFSTSSR